MKIWPPISTVVPVSCRWPTVVRTRMVVNFLSHVPRRLIWVSCESLLPLGCVPAHSPHQQETQNAFCCSIIINRRKAHSLWPSPGRCQHADGTKMRGSSGQWIDTEIASDNYTMWGTIKALLISVKLHHLYSRQQFRGTKLLVKRYRNILSNKTF